jgi:hypothetical protein
VGLILGNDWVVDGGGVEHPGRGRGVRGDVPRRHARELRGGSPTLPQPAGDLPGRPPQPHLPQCGLRGLRLAVKLPANYRYLAAFAAAADEEVCGDRDGNGKRFPLAATKEEIYVHLCRPTVFDAARKVIHLIFFGGYFFVRTDLLSCQIHMKRLSVLFLAFCLLKLFVFLNGIYAIDCRNSGL